MAISDKNTQILVTLPKELKQLLTQKAKENNRSVSNYVVNLIQKDCGNSPTT